MMETTLAGIPGIIFYFDDVIVSGATRQEHATRLEEVLQRLETAKLRLRKEKCRFALHEVSYLGHKIDAAGVHPRKTR